MHTAFCGNDVALIGHLNALDGTEQRDVFAGVIVETGSGHGADGAAVTGRHEGEVLADQYGADRGITRPLHRDHAAMHVGLQAMVAAEEGRHLRDIEFTTLLNVLQRAAADCQGLR